MIKFNSNNLGCKLNEIKIELSHQCNLRCIHCSSGATADQYKCLSFEQVESIIRQASQLSVKSISFSGGEPLMWPELENIVNLCLASGIFVRIYTNGATSNASLFLKRILHKNLSVIVSLHGFKATHDHITAVSGSYDATLQTIRDLACFGYFPEIHFVPMRINYHEIFDFAVFMNSIGVKRISVLRFVPHGRGQTNDKLALTNEQHLYFRRSIILLKEININIRTGSPFNILLLNNQPCCTSGSDKLIVSPDLCVYPCDAFKQITPGDLNISDEYFSLKQHTLQDCWNNSSYLKFVRDLSCEHSPQECISCVNHSLCRSGCLAQKILFSQNFTHQKDPGCLMLAPGGINGSDFFK